jgi:hypothetical protein
MSASVSSIACCGALIPVCVDEGAVSRALGCCAAGAACGCEGGVWAGDAEGELQPAKAAVSTAAASPHEIPALDMGQS